MTRSHKPTTSSTYASLTPPKLRFNHKRLIPLYKQIYETYPNGYVHPSIIDNKLFILPKEDQSYIVITPHNKTVDIKIEDKTYKNINWADLKEHLQGLQ